MRSEARVAARILISPAPPSYSLSVTNEIVTVPPSPRHVQLGGLRSSLSQRMSGYRTSVGNWLPPKPVRPVSVQSAFRAIDQLDDVHPRRRVPLERVDGTKVRGVRDRDPVTVRAGQGSQRRAEVVPVHHGIDVDGDPPADDRDVRSRDGDRRPLSRGRRTCRALVNRDNERGDHAADRESHAAKTQASLARPRGRLIAADHTRPTEPKRPPAGKVEVRPFRGPGKSCPCAAVRRVWGDGVLPAAVRVRSRWATAAVAR